MPKTAKATATSVAVTKTNNWPSELSWANLLLGQRAGQEQWSALKPSYNNNASREYRRETDKAGKRQNRHKQQLESPVFCRRMRREISLHKINANKRATNRLQQQKQQQQQQ